MASSRPSGIFLEADGRIERGLRSNHISHFKQDAESLCCKAERKENRKSDWLDYTRGIVESCKNLTHIFFLWLELWWLKCAYLLTQVIII